HDERPLSRPFKPRLSCWKDCGRGERIRTSGLLVPEPSIKPFQDVPHASEPYQNVRSFHSLQEQPRHRRPARSVRLERLVQGPRPAVPPPRSSSGAPIRTGSRGAAAKPAPWVLGSRLQVSSV